MSDPASSDQQAAPRPASVRPVPAPRGVLPRDQVRIVSQPAMVDCATDAHGRTMTVVPLMDGDRVAGLEVRCSCGSATLIECVYQENDR